MTYIYALVDPRTSEIRYIGKTVNLRGRFALHKHQRANNHKCNWFQSVVRSGFMPELVVLEETDEWREAESFFIQYFKGMGARLTNSSKGGESGPVGWKPTEDQRLKMREHSKSVYDDFRRHPLLYPHLIEFCYGARKPASEKSIESARNRMLAMWSDPAKRKELSEEIKDRHRRGVYPENGKYLPRMTKEAAAKACVSKRKSSGWSKLGLKGVAVVYRDKNGGCKYSSHAMLDKRTYLGCFSDPTEAALVRDKAMFEYWGNEAYLNFPERFKVVTSVCS